MSQGYEINGFSTTVTKDGRLFVPADETVNLVRGIGGALLNMANDDQQGHEPRTLRALAAKVQSLADSMDLHFIEEASDSILWLRDPEDRQ